MRVMTGIGSDRTVSSFALRITKDLELGELPELRRWHNTVILLQSYGR